MDGPPRRAWEGVVSPAAALWGKWEASGSAQGAQTRFEGTCRVPGPSDWELVVPALRPKKCPPWSRPSTGVGGCEQKPGPSRAAPFNEREPEMHSPASLLHGGERAGGRQTRRDHRPWRGQRGAASGLPPRTIALCQDPPFPDGASRGGSQTRQGHVP